MAKRLLKIGTHVHLLKQADSQGVINTDASKNTYMHLGQKKLKIKDFVKEFGPSLCIGPCMSGMLGDYRFSVCNGTGPEHASFSSVAHTLPKDYKARVSQIFR
jgi:hypothetical protein